MRIENKRPDFDLVAEQENETTTLASVPQRQAEKDPTKKIGWHTSMKKFLIQMQQGRPNQEAQHKKMQHKFFNLDPHKVYIQTRRSPSSLPHLIRTKIDSFQL
jgi:hypothetical protein